MALPCSLEPVSELTGHDDRVWHLAWNPTKPLLASCSADKTVRLSSYRVDTHNPGAFSFAHLITIPTGHAKTVRAVAWSPSGKTLATASFDANIGIWEPGESAEDDDMGDERRAGEEWECMSLLEGHETECKSVSYSSSGSYLATCSRDKTVWIWEVHPDSDFECVSVLMEHTQDVKCVAWHPSEEILASASYDDTIKLYMDDPTDDWFCFDTLNGHTSTVWSIAFSPTGSHLASASEDRTVRIWAPSSSQQSKWEQAAVITGHERSVYSVAWAPAGENEGDRVGLLASTGGDGVICVWDVRIGSTPAQLTTTLLARLPSAHGVHDVNAIAWCPREQGRGLLASAGDDGCVRVWKLCPG